MTWAAYGAFLAFAIVLILVPGPDFAVVTKNALAAGSWRGGWAAAGVGCSNAVQRAAATAGLGAVIVRVQPLFDAVKWAGAGYLVHLGVQSLRSAARGQYPPLYAGGGPPRTGSAALAGWRQRFLSNITNPKVLVFYLAVLPQFLPARAGVAVLLAFALSHAVLSFGYLVLLALALKRAPRILERRRVRRALDATTGAVLLGFSARLVAEHA
jgi:threonine/homoserine/homoserine lactone efflux protein